ncbi:TraB/GumN family protein [Asticcacaulis sp. EMRT-3]|uniref:TraB/GumN family protein n=1 Tax=Asticcacaulis sp. EMRT-3 TaxID=3040349 RepID=UPI0024AF6202|nr:TraB/GumN family protein [Asticcacaulis sp. EMRT-3]MDI7775452.1 TraB/GumN family protein [Asticcacaulis sp. EMRT-3]
MFKAIRASLMALVALTAFQMAPLMACAQTAPEAAPASTVAHPLMWVIRDADSTIYLFGSIHVMKPGTVWLSDAVRQRFDSADQAWFEVADLDDTAAIMRESQKYLVNPANNMTQGLTPEEIRKLDKLLAPYGMSSARMMGLRKWAVGLYLDMQQVQAAGYNPQTGVDLTLLKRARSSGKAIHGFETVNEEMQKVAPASEAEDMAALRETLRDSSDARADVAALFRAWAQGDEKRLTYYMVDKMKAAEPGMYQRVIVERDAAWEPQIETILKGKGTAFITVGVGHLVGPDSLIAMLKAHGISATQLR